MRELFFKCSPLLLTLLTVKLKTFILSLKCRYLPFQRRVLIVRQRNALLENDRRAMLVNELFDTVKKAGHKSPAEHNV